MPEHVVIELKEYKFRFKSLSWKEEFSLVFNKKKDPKRTILSNALQGIEGQNTLLSLKDATKIIDSFTSPIVNKLYIVYRARLSPPRAFKTTSLYQAPEPAHYQERVKDQEELLDNKVQSHLSKFSKEEIDEALDVEKQMFKSKTYAGAVKRGLKRSE